MGGALLRAGGAEALQRIADRAGVASGAEAESCHSGRSQNARGVPAGCSGVHNRFERKRVRMAESGMLNEDEEGT